MSGRRRLLILGFLGSLMALMASCSPAALNTVAAVAQGAAQAGGTASSESSSAKLMVFGGENHRTYLGCLNCSQYATDSIFNPYGENGSRYSSESIWNHFSDYGSAYSSFGACNSYASDPPVIVDATGKYYGRLSLNSYHAEFGLGAKFYSWLKENVCESN